nr:hypothetical protein [Bacteroidaceae bacterium]
MKTIKAKGIAYKSNPSSSLVSLSSPIHRGRQEKSGLGVRSAVWGRLVLLFALLCLPLRLLAQEVMVTVTPVQQVLPPHVYLYLLDTGKYFNITLTNLTDEPQNVYLGFQLEQKNPSNGLAIITPPKRQPTKPYIIPAKGVYQLSMVEMKEMFNHIPLSEVQAPADLFENYSNGGFGLLPEGLYSIHITAYKWNNPDYVTPQVASSAEDGSCFFNICYNAQAPKFLTPVSIGFGQDESDAVAIDPLSPQFTWTPPVVVCNPTALRYEYDFTVVEMLPLQNPDDALAKNPVFYQARGLTDNIAIIPQQIIATMNPNATYVAIVRAYNKSTTSAQLNYTQIENNGKSDFKLFKLKVANQPEEQEQEEEEQEEEEEEEGMGIFGGASTEAFLNPDSAYTYRLPRLTRPTFDDGTARKRFAFEEINVEWDGVYHLGGNGQQPDTLEFEYEVELFNGATVADKKLALEGEPIYSKTFGEDEEFKLTIPWEDIEELVHIGDYMVLRVRPVAKGTSVAFAEDTINVVDFAMAEHLAEKYFQCSSTTKIENKEPTEKKDKELKGTTVDIGQYELTIDEIKGSGESGFQGKGRVAWSPLGFTTMVCVQFEKLMINTDGRVYEGTCESYADDPQSDIECVDKLFSDWGIDNLIGDSNIPSAEYLQQGAVDVAKDLAKKIDLKEYYGYIKTGKNLLDLAKKGSVDRLYMPLAIPKDINTSPVDIQIAGMKFAPDHATMNLIGQFVLPESDYLENDILVLGCPRVCISPDRLLPEGGTLALLSDFTIKDPNTTFDITFKAPQDLLYPKDGCYVAWKDDKMEIFGIDAEMSIPGAVKDVNGEATTEQPKLRFTASVAKWTELVIDEMSIDPFQVEDLPGWTFTADKVIIDLATHRNAAKMGSFPNGYKGETGVGWQGLYVKEISVQFPKSMEFGTSASNSDNDNVQGKRLKISATDMFFDKTGATLSLGADNVLSAEAQGTLGGWAFSLDKVGLSILQNNFQDCHFSGTFGVPLVDGKIGYSCNIQKLKNVSKEAKQQYAYIFKTQQVDGLSLDFFLAKATFNKDQTYLLVEATPEKDKLKTKVELLMGGYMTIGGDDLDFELPDIAFSQFRIANCTVWNSEFEGKMQKAARERKNSITVNGKKKSVKYLISDKTYEISKDKCYISRGSWGLASAAKKLGPFEFTLNKFDIDYSNDLLKLTADGKVAIVQGIDLSAQASVTVEAEVKNLTDLSNLSIKYKKTTLNDLVVNSTFAGCSFDGSLHHEDGENTGYSGNMAFKLPGEFLIIQASAAYYDYDDGKGNAFTWGFLKAKVGSKTGIEITPIKIQSITGGFYFNCRRDDDDEKGAKPEKGLIGVVVGLELSTTAGESALKGDFEMTCIYDKKKKRLTSFVLNGHMEALDGMIDADASIVYHHDDNDQYIALNVTVDAEADASELAGSIQKYTNQFQSQIDKLKEKGYKLVSDVSGGLAGKLETDSDEKAEKSKNTKKPVEVKAGATVRLDFRVTMKKDGKQCSPVKWHLYLGEPGDGKNPTADEMKRCRFVLIDFQSAIVNVNIGANAYLCIGNELPNGGKLPPIASKVRKFLDGASKGKGVQSASQSEANAARQKAMDEVLEAAASGCGVMLGATAYGYIDLDFGLLYGNFGVTAGFDVALTK